MPVYSEETYFYEVLMRFGEVAPNKGKLIGASLTQLTQLLKDGVVLNTSINPPEQLTLVDGENGQKLSDVLGSVTADTIVQNQTLADALAVEQGKTASLTNDLIQSTAQIQTVTQQLAAANAEIAHLKALIANASLTTGGEPEEPAETV